MSAYPRTQSHFRPLEVVEQRSFVVEPGNPCSPKIVVSSVLPEIPHLLNEHITVRDRHLPQVHELIEVIADWLHSTLVL
jgi:hypothetical protein